jgi:hypothetical protein
MRRRAAEDSPAQPLIMLSGSKTCKDAFYALLECSRTQPCKKSGGFGDLDCPHRKGAAWISPTCGSRCYGACVGQKMVR